MSHLYTRSTLHNLKKTLSADDKTLPSKKITRIGVYGVCIKDKKILLIEQKKGPFKGKLDFPGGGIEFGESPEETLQREFAEEVAMSFTSFQLIDNLTSTLQVPGTDEKEPYLFYQIGMIYRIIGIHPIEESICELTHNWYDLATLSEEHCSRLLWQFLQKHSSTPLFFLEKNNNYKIIDLTHSLEPNIPSWEGNCGFYNEISLDYPDCQTEVKFRTQKIEMEAGIGTHIDAPAHCIPNGITIDELQLNNLIAPCIVIDVSKNAHEHYSVSIDDIKEFEKRYGVISEGQFVMIKTGWEQFWDEPKKYHNNHFFPSISAEAAKFLLERNIVGIGIDTLSPDRPESGYPVHSLLLGAGKIIVENVANLASMPPVGSFIIALPLKIKGGTEAPIRLVALTY